MSVPLFSVIVPFRNAVATLPETLASLRAQTLQDWEALLIDDASSDAGPAVVAELAAHDGRLRLIQESLDPQPRGAAATRNLGIRASQGRYVAFLDADDLWLPEKLSQQAAVLQSGAHLVFSSYRRIDMEGRQLSVVKAREQVTWSDAISGNPIGCLTAVYDTARFGRAEMPILPMHEDYAFWLRLLRDENVAIGLPEILAEYRVRPGSLSANKLAGAASVWRILAAEGIGPPLRVASFCRYARTALLRRF